ncbi:hypothetical protein Tco_0992434 [Tanacetum coccineum]|uniref:Uncharacterized protein n=1 Tax=Tanacetum coccineum TaxID=301880 RepID=A0ABQ5F2G1_9ASTR
MRLNRSFGTLRIPLTWDSGIRRTPVSNLTTSIFHISGNHTTGCLDSHKSTSGGIQFLGDDKVVNWSSKKQDCTSMSSAEAEYVSISVCYAQVLVDETQFKDMGASTLTQIPLLFKRRCCNLVPVKSDSLTHAHTQAFKFNHSASRVLILHFLIIKELQSTDISKITRKPSKTGKHGHEERKSTKEARDAKPKAGKVKKSKLWSTLGQFSVNKSQP